MKNKNKLIYSSTDYTRFVQDDENRAAGDHPKLLASMKKHGWLPEHPAIVIPDSGKFRIKDGGHRITFAELLKLPVYYVITEHDDLSIAEINAAVMGWNNKSYITSHIRRGNKHYQRLLDFAIEKGLPVGVAANLLGGGGENSQTSRIRAGTFTIKAEDHAQRVVQVVGVAGQVVKWARCSRFISAVSQILRHSRADIKVLCDKIRANGPLMLPQVTTESFIEMLENVYNYRNRDMVSIAMAVKQAQRALVVENLSKANKARK